MDRDVPIGNRLIHQRIQQFRARKHRQTLSSIKTRNNSNNNQTMYSNQQLKNNRYSSGYLDHNKQIKAQKNLEIQKQNIKLFNKIASIIREKPKIIQSTTYLQSFKSANFHNKKKRQQRLKTQNQLLVKRLSQQKPTINNKQLFKDRIKNIKYLKLMGKYPYQKLKKSQNQHSTPTSNLSSFRNNQELLHQYDLPIYQKKIQGFFVQIIHASNQHYVLTVQNQLTKKIYQMIMKKDVFQQQFMRCEYNYDKIIRRLRLNQNEEVVFDQIEDEDEQK